MQLRAEEISQIIKKQIQNFDKVATVDETGTVLIGFSQGTMMSLHVGLRRARQLAGIVGFSGALAGPEVLKDEIRSRPPVLLVHGDSDEMLPAALTEEAAVALQRNGVEVAVHIAQGVGHGIDQTGLSNAARFLLNVLRLPMPQRSARQRVPRASGTNCCSINCCHKIGRAHV